MSFSAHTQQDQQTFASQWPSFRGNVISQTQPTDVMISVCYCSLYHFWFWPYKFSRIMTEAEICEGASAIGPNNLSSSRQC